MKRSRNSRIADEEKTAAPKAADWKQAFKSLSHCVEEVYRVYRGADKQVIKKLGGALAIVDTQQRAQTELEVAVKTAYDVHKFLVKRVEELQVRKVLYIGQRNAKLQSSWQQYQQNQAQEQERAYEVPVAVSMKWSAFEVPARANAASQLCGLCVKMHKPDALRWDCKCGEQFVFYLGMRAMGQYKRLLRHIRNKHTNMIASLWAAPAAVHMKKLDEFQDAVQALISSYEMFVEDNEAITSSCTTTMTTTTTTTMTTMTTITANSAEELSDLCGGPHHLRGLRGD